MKRSLRVHTYHNASLYIKSKLQFLKKKMMTPSQAREEEKKLRTIQDFISGKIYHTCTD